MVEFLSMFSGFGKNQGYIIKNVRMSMDVLRVWGICRKEKARQLLGLTRFFNKNRCWAYGRRLAYAVFFSFEAARGLLRACKEAAVACHCFGLCGNVHTHVR